MAILTVYEMIPKAKLASYCALISVTIALATVTAPIFAGLIENKSTWRWFFYLKSAALCTFPSKSSVRCSMEADSLLFQSSLWRARSCPFGHLNAFVFRIKYHFLDGREKFSKL